MDTIKKVLKFVGALILIGVGVVVANFITVFVVGMLGLTAAAPVVMIPMLIIVVLFLYIDWRVIKGIWNKIF